MNLFLEANTNVKDLIVDFIEVKLSSGQTVSLNWDRSSVTRHKGSFNTLYSGVCFDEEDASGRLEELKGLQVVNVGLYSEKVKKADVSFKILAFFDGENSLCFENPFSIIGGDASG